MANEFHSDLIPDDFVQDFLEPGDDAPVVEREVNAKPVNDFVQFPSRHPMVPNADGGQSNVRLQSVGGPDPSDPTGESDQPVQAIPTMVDGKQLTGEDAFEVARGLGLEKYPTFETVEGAEKWIAEHHGNIQPDGTLLRSLPAEVIDGALADSKDRGRNTMSALYDALPEKDPAKAATTRKIERQTGLPAEFVAGMEDEWADRIEREGLDALNLPEHAPKVFDWMRKSTSNAAAAWKHGAEAKAVESISRNAGVALVQKQWRQMERDAEASLAQIQRDLGYKYEVGDINLKRGKLGTFELFGGTTPPPEALAELKRRGDAAQENNQDVNERRPGFIEGAPFTFAESVPLYLDMLPRVAVAGTIGAAATRIPVVGPTIKAFGSQTLRVPGAGPLLRRFAGDKSAAAISGQLFAGAAAWNATAQIEGGNLYYDLLDDFPEAERDDAAIKFLSMVGGTVSGGLEVAGDAMILRAGSLVRSGANGAFVKPTDYVRSLAPQFMKKLARNPRLRKVVEGMIGEGVTEGLQAFPGIVSNEILNVYFGALQRDSGEELTWGDAIERIVLNPETWHEVAESARAGMQGGGFASSTLAAGAKTWEVITDSGRAVAGEQTEFVLSELAEKVRAMSDLHDQDQASLRGLLGAALEDGPIEMVLIDADGLRTALQSEDLTPEDFFAQLGPEEGIKALELYDEALTNGTDMEVSMPDYSATIMNTPVHAKAAEHMRLREDDMTPAERRTWRQSQGPEQLADLALEEQEGQDDVSRTESFVTELSEAITRQLGAASNFSVQTSELQAQLPAHALVALAKRMGLSEDAVSDLVKLQVGRIDNSQPATGSQRLQPDSPDSAFIDLLAAPNESAIAGFEEVISEENGIEVLEADERQAGAFVRRYVKSVDGDRVSVLQVITNEDGSATVLNAFTSDGARRAGHASELLARAREDFPSVTHNLSLSEDGRAFANATLADGEVLSDPDEGSSAFQSEFVAEPGDTRGADNPSRVSARLPTGKGRGAKNNDQETGIASLSVGLEAMERASDSFKKNMKLVREYVGFPKVAKESDADAARRFVSQAARNLLSLYDAIDPEVRDRAKLWYTGARNVTERWSAEFGQDTSTVAGVIASLSPQKDWFENASLVERVLTTWRDNQDTAFTEEMRDAGARLLGVIQAEIAKKQKKGEPTSKSEVRLDAFNLALAAVDGLTLTEAAQIDAYHAGVWIRMHDEANNTRDVKVLSPEGDFGDVVRKLDGDPAKIRWQTYGALAHAVSMLMDPSLENVSAQLGNKHKVRSFYNNILTPDAGTDVTIDTHAVAAALLRPLSGSSIEVSHNFATGKGSSSNANVGVSGTYGLYAEAYRQAAAARGVLPREMQSVTWEAARALFPATKKGQKTYRDQFDKVWAQFAAGELTQEEARRKTYEFAGDVPAPEWFGSNSGSAQEDGARSNAGELSGADGSGAGPDAAAGSGDRSGATDRAAAGTAGRRPLFSEPDSGTGSGADDGAAAGVDDTRAAIEAVGALGLLGEDGAIALPGSNGQTFALEDLHKGTKVSEAAQRALFAALGLPSEPGTNTNEDLKIYRLSEVFGETVESVNETLQPWLDRVGWSFNLFGPKAGPDGKAIFPQFILKDGTPNPDVETYDDRVAWLFDPSEEGGSFFDTAYTLAWRATHEIAHGIVNKRLTKKYGGDGRRAGAMGVVIRGPFHKQNTALTLADAMRAVEWEHETFVEQRRILEEEFGVLISDEDFNRENSANLVAAVYRAMTGQFADPGDLGVQTSTIAPDELLANAMNLLRVASEEISGDRNETLPQAEPRVAFQPDGPNPVEPGNRGPRGITNFPATFGLTPTQIGLADHANKSTFLHETWHVLIEVLGHLASSSEAPAQIVNDYNKLLEFVGLDPGQPLVDPAEIDPALQEWRAARRSGDRAAIAAAEAKVNHANRHAEKLAVEGERYLATGKAPSVELQGAFGEYRRWLVQVYKNFRNFFRVDPSEEIHEVFARVLATDEQIAEAQGKQKSGRLFREKPPKMSESKWAALRKAEEDARDEAYNTLAAEQSRADQRARDEMTDARREEIHAEVEVEIRSDAAHQVRQWLANGIWIGPGDGPISRTMPRGKLDPDSIPQEWLSRLPRGSGGVVAGRKGVKYDALDIANIFMGIPGEPMATTEDLFEALESTLPFKQAIEAESQRRIDEEGVNATTGEDALDAIHNDAAAKLQRLGLVELREQVEREGREREVGSSGGNADPSPDDSGAPATPEAPQPAVPASDPGDFNPVEARRRAATAARKANADQREMRRLAKDHIERTKIGQLRADRFSAAERRSAERSRVAVAAGKFVEAADFVLKEIWNHFAYRAARAAQIEVEKHLKFLRRYDKVTLQREIARAGRTSKDDTATPYWDQIELILSGLELRKSQREFTVEQTLAEFIKDREDAGRAMAFVEKDITSLMTRRHFRELTVGELRRVREAVENIEFAAKEDLQVTIDGEKQDLDLSVEAMRAEMEASLEPGKESKNESPGPLGKLKEGRSAVHAHLTKPESFLRKLAGFQPGSFIHRALFQPFRDAQFNQARRMEKVSAQLTAALDAWGSDVEVTRIGSPFKRTHVAAVDRNFTREELITIGLNVGNAENRLALRLGREHERRGGNAWSEQQLDAVLDTLEQRDWVLIQSIWDSLEFMRPDIMEHQLRVNGVRPKLVNADEVVTKFGTFNGGYYPLKYDARKSRRAAQRDAKAETERMFGGGSLRIQTQQGHFQERVGSGKQFVKLGFGVLFQHVDKVVHDLTHREAVMDAMKIINHPDFESSVREFAGDEGYALLQPWVHRMAGELRDPTNPIDNWLRSARTAATVGAMGLKATTGLMQPVGILNSAATIGYSQTMRAVKSFYQPGSFGEQWAFVMERSKEMPDRMSNLDRDIRDIHKRLSTSKIRRLADHGYFWHLGMADMLISMPTWMAAYTQGMDELFDGDEQSSINHADTMVLQTQGGGAVKDLAAVQAGTETQRIFVMFYSYMSALYQQVAEDVHHIKDNKLDLATRAHAVGDLFVRMVVATVVAELVVGRGPEDDEEWIAWGIQKTVQGGIGTVPVVRDVVGAALSEYPFSISPVAGVLESPAKVAKQIGQGEIDRGLFRSVSDMLAFAFRLPARQGWITGEFLWDYSMGDADSEGFEVIRDLLLPRPKERKNQ